MIFDARFSIVAGAISQIENRESKIQNPSFAAVLLAGGGSTRMGRDKALLPLPDGRLLWQRQWEILLSLSPNQCLISGYFREGFPKESVVADPQPGLGPLAGVAAALGAVDAPFLLVLAVDMPAMTAEFLSCLLGVGSGVVPCRGGWFEPLAAVYPKAALPIAEACLKTSDRSLQTFVRRLLEAGLVNVIDIPPEKDHLFANWNKAS
ncbi:MAG TPA: molybdenum cofactor guanylyltransferase [Chthoniobacterales bacterium]